jgi:parallel beta-helix repeat protein
VYTDFEGGGTKFTGNNITISNNVAHDNYGVGLFTDAGAVNDTYNNNTSYNNYAGGIRYETSRYGTITNNTVYGNWGKNPEIVYTGSDHGRIYGNTVIDNGFGAIQIWNTFGTVQSVYGVYQVTDTRVGGNTIYIPSNSPDPVVVGLQDFGSPLQPSIYADPSNVFDWNIYNFDGGYRAIWHWGDNINVYVPLDWAHWQGSGQDHHGTVKVGVPEP